MRKPMILPVQREMLPKIGAYLAQSYGGRCVATAVDKDEGMVRFQVVSDASTFRVGVPFGDLTWYLNQAEAVGL